MDKPIYASLTNQGSVGGTMGAALFLIGETMTKNIHLNWIQWAGVSFLFFGVLAHLIGNRRAKGVLINQQRAILDHQIRSNEQNSTILKSLVSRSELNNGSSNHSN